MADRKKQRNPSTKSIFVKKVIAMAIPSNAKKIKITPRRKKIIESKIKIFNELIMPFIYK